MNKILYHNTEIKNPYGWDLWIKLFTKYIEKKEKYKKDANELVLYSLFPINEKINASHDNSVDYYKALKQYMFGEKYNKGLYKNIIRLDVCKS